MKSITVKNVHLYIYKQHWSTDYIRRVITVDIAGGGGESTFSTLCFGVKKKRPKNPVKNLRCLIEAVKGENICVKSPGRVSFQGLEILKPTFFSKKAVG